MRPKTRFTYRKELNMKVRMYKLIQEIVDSGIESGYQYACKHTENPHPDTIKHCIEQYIMQGFDEHFTFEHEEL